MQPFIGQIQAFAFNFTPRGWASCDGQLLPISSYTALFSLLGTMYGGDGRITFALPDLRGRVPIHAGQGPGLSLYQVGLRGGRESVSVHQIARSQSEQSEDQEGFISNAITPGNNHELEIKQPYLVLNWCIAIEGVFPERS